ncbi:MAG TPA: hypothetical protein VGP33_14610 [Chloroflexota bacterium]|nr:hypothetical protein [Chloroflexota bacterium]
MQVEFAPEHVPGLAFFSMQDELASIIERPVDLNTPQFLIRSFRDEVMAASDTIYAGG